MIREDSFDADDHSKMMASRLAMKPKTGSKLSLYETNM